MQPGDTITVHVTPKASRARIIEGPEGLRVYVTVVPEDGKANSAVQKLVAKWLGLPKSAVRVVTGGKTRLKGLEIDGPPELAARLSGDDT